MSYNECFYGLISSKRFWLNPAILLLSVMAIFGNFFVERPEPIAISTVKTVFATGFTDVMICLVWSAILFFSQKREPQIKKSAKDDIYFEEVD